MLLFRTVFAKRFSTIWTKINNFNRKQNNFYTKQKNHAPKRVVNGTPEHKLKQKRNEADYV